MIRTVDGATTRVPGGDRQTMRTHVAKIGRAINSAAIAREAYYARLDNFTGPLGNRLHHETSGSIGRGPIQTPSVESVPATALTERVRRLNTLIISVELASIPHKDALLNLLGVVTNHQRGLATREAAISHWRGFADYVRQYLSHQHELLHQTESLDREMRLI